MVDLRPVDAGGKREAVERLVRPARPGAVVVLGDELSDVDAFEAVIAARAAGRVDGRPDGRGPWPTDGRRPTELLARCATCASTSARAVGPFLAALARAVERVGRLDAGRRRGCRTPATVRSPGRLADDLEQRRREQAEQDGQRGRGGQPAPQQRAVAQGRRVACAGSRMNM